MPETTPASPASPPQPGQAPGAAPPVGVSPATQATPNRGMEMAGLQGLALMQKIGESLIPRFGSGSEIGQDMLKILKLINKHVQAGNVGQAGMQNEMQNQMRRMQSGQAQLAQMRQQMARPGGAGGPAPGGAPPPGMTAPAGPAPGMAA